MASIEESSAECQRDPALAALEARGTAGSYPTAAVCDLGGTIPILWRPIPKRSSRKSRQPFLATPSPTLPAGSPP